MTTADDALMVEAATPSNVGILVDVGQLNVSAQTHGRSPYSELEALTDVVQGYHLSDNDGLSDSNRPITSDSWFIRHLLKDLPYYVLEVYRTTVDELKLQADFLEAFLS
jgi:sugar phosphate isomerase/epimerase